MTASHFALDLSEVNLTMHSILNLRVKTVNRGIYRRCNSAAKRPGRNIFHQAGLTLIELMVTIAVVAVILTIGVPSVTNFFDSKRLIDAAEQVAGHMQLARVEAISRSDQVFVIFDASQTTTPSATWAYTFSTRDDCDQDQTTATGTNACILVIDDGDGTVHNDDLGVTDNDDLILSRYTSADHGEVSMSISGGSAATDGQEMTFDGTRGTAQNVMTIMMQSAEGRRLQVEVNAMGRVKLCEPTGGTIAMIGYEAC